MIHSYDFRLPFLDTDANRELTVTGALDLMQDAADSHTISVVDPDYLASSHRIWVLNSWLVYFDKPCHGRDILKMSTWSAGLNRIFASRFFTIADSAGDTCVRARTFWFLVDDRTMRPVRPTEEDIGYYIPSPALDLEDPGRKISVPDHLEQAEPPFPVRRYMQDAYGHVNNAWYVRLAMEYLPEGFKVRRLRAEYKTAAHLGNRMLPLVSRSEHCVTVVLADGEKSPYAVLEFCD
jgi:acyl-ACP thioesterase